ncbi:MAG: transglycosylase domain-containing protein [Spirochaetales bacterium]|nr:transglycosylase domain-containing protein [Spirochaetales bacterium]
MRKGRVIFPAALAVILLYFLFIHPFICGGFIARRIHCKIDSPPRYEEEFYDLVQFMGGGNNAIYLDTIGTNLLFTSPEFAGKGTFNNNIAAMRLIRWLSLSTDRYSVINQYVKTAHMGNGIYGIEKGAKFYFSKGVDDLTDREVIELILRSFQPARFSLEKDSETLQKRVEEIYGDYHSTL